MVLISNNFVGQSQISDTICVPVAKMKSIYTAAQLYRYTDSLLKISDQQVNELIGKIDLLEQKDTATVNGYNRQLKDLKDIIAEYKLEKKEYERLLKWEKFKRKFWSGVGGVTVGVMGYLLITK